MYCPNLIFSKFRKYENTRRLIRNKWKSSEKLFRFFNQTLFQLMLLQVVFSCLLFLVVYLQFLRKAWEGFINNSFPWAHYIPCSARQRFPSPSTRWETREKPLLATARSFDQPPSTTRDEYIKNTGFWQVLTGFLKEIDIPFQIFD